jgi:hypothetical protein
MAMMSRGEFQCLHWVKDVRESPWTWTCVLLCSCSVVVVDIDVEAVFVLVVDAVLELLVDVACRVSQFFDFDLLRSLPRFQSLGRFQLIEEEAPL